MSCLAKLSAKILRGSSRLLNKQAAHLARPNTQVFLKSWLVVKISDIEDVSMVKNGCYVRAGVLPLDPFALKLIYTID